jgi:hypothetical protein
MIRHGTLSPFITDITNSGEKEHSSPTRDGISPPFAACLEYFQGATGRCPTAKIKIGRRFAGNRRGGLTVAAIYGSWPPLPMPGQSAK